MSLSSRISFDVVIRCQTHHFTSTSLFASASATDRVRLPLGSGGHANSYVSPPDRQMRLIRRRWLTLPLLTSHYASGDASIIANGYSRLRRRRVNCAAINPSARAEINLFQLLPLLPVPVILTLLTHIPLPDISLALSYSLTTYRYVLRHHGRSET